MSDRKPSSATPGDPATPPRETPSDALAQRYAEALARLSDGSSRAWQGWFERQARGDFFSLPDPAVAARALTRLSQQFMLHPQRALELQQQLWQGYTTLWQNTARRLAGEAPSPVAAPGPRDRRFKGKGWEENLFFDALRQAYQLTAEQWLKGVHEVTEELDHDEQVRVEFYAQQLMDALAPGNYALTNPEVIEATVHTGGANLLQGLANLMEDLARGEGLLRIRQSDSAELELGRNLAVTPGEVIFQNELMQLIQYAPTTETVDRRPLLIVPPWINKFYILDLTPQRSFIRWAVAQGITVFVISWVNPDERYAEVAFDDYLTRGTLKAMDVVAEVTGEATLNTIGYCIGGTLLACTLAHQAARGDERVHSATFFTTLLDFSEVGPLEVFIDEEQIRHIEQHMAQRGYLEGTHLANAFNLLQSADLIWGFVINNYLLGRTPQAFDLLYWNSDSTRMPRRMQSFYLRNMYLENRLAEPGGISLAGQAIDLSRVRIPTFFVATEKDHIAPWQSSYRGAHLLGKQPRFLLGGSGHIAGVINPAGSSKYGYWSYGRLPKDPERWLASATHHPGSWWPEWRHWLQRHAGGQVAARDPGSRRYPPLEEAPGSYVRVRVDDASMGG
ncbi:PHA/PHB synthase family protein [Modicisalibacter tunisiensis]|uniref:Class I poly(R)-hydroxyalkanoic acid synthase n=1 Tax=Modicisalibacter tunisiensis TaxID=390637 RepID=A0ABS7X1B4_9GAMM|nr:class I poly(R)-hydroxyalkanoic acid synthase [Modicisalibacter tunisiensis]MBZ9538845.1 class I poly(R)-hydroxyalkanoic acid synthase [Modicisalibacter tunisiensis]MBZ9567746.1 class I poly(R)-hydroxyalkanoic acid synthase [Modicisalibacter tunisiensis]